MAEWPDGTNQGIEFCLGNESRMIAGSLGPALCGLWFDDFMEAIHHWNPEAGDSANLDNRAEQGADDQAAAAADSKAE